MAIQKIKSHLWFDNQAEEAAGFYTGIFDSARIIKTSHYGKAGQEIHKMPEGSVMTVEFELEGQRFVALNGGPLFKFNESISFMVSCGTQDEIDRYWQKLGDGGDKKAQQCGWLKDKFGLSWQIVPERLSEMLAEDHPEKSQRVMTAFLAMKKIDIRALEDAYHGKTVSAY